MSSAANTTYQGILQRLQSLVSPSAAPVMPAPMGAAPSAAVQLPAAAPVMAADSFVRTFGFQMPQTGSFVVGSYGPQVGALQTHLASLGYLAGMPDQIYANGTVEAVTYFQMEYGLPATGMFDMAAYQTMMAVFSGQLPWRRGAVVAQPAPQPVQQNPLGMDWVSAPQPAAPQPAASQPVTAQPNVQQPVTQNPLGIDWVTAPQPAAPPQASQPAPKPEPKPEPKPVPKPEPKPEPKPSAHEAAIEALKKLTPSQLTQLGATDKKGFFAIMRPAAEESERKHGVPAAVTMAQAALETGWGKHIIPGFNIFGIKGKGPAGTVSKETWEHYNGKDVTITANFAKYHNFYEAVSEHGKRFHNGYYDKAIAAYAKDPDPFQFARNITGIYATDPNYGDKLISIMKTYDLV